MHWNIEQIIWALVLAAHLVLLVVLLGRDQRASRFLVVYGGYRSLSAGSPVGRPSAARQADEHGFLLAELLGHGGG